MQRKSLLALAILLGLGVGLLIAAQQAGKKAVPPTAPPASPTTSSAPAIPISATAAPTSTTTISTNAAHPAPELGFSALFHTPLQGASAVTSGAEGRKERSSLWFSQALALQGQQYWAQFFISQELGEDGLPVDYHAASVSVSVATFVQNASGWQLISQQRDFSQTGSYGQASDPEPQLLPLTKQQTAVLTSTSNFGQGVYLAGKTVLLFDGQTWKDAGFIDTKQNNDGACDPTPRQSPQAPDADADNYLYPSCFAWEGQITLAPGTPSASVLPDLQVVRHSTLAAKLEARLPEPDADSYRTVRYTFKNGAYQDTAQGLQP